MNARYSSFSKNLAFNSFFYVQKGAYVITDTISIAELYQLINLDAAVSHTVENSFTDEYLLSLFSSTDFFAIS